MKAQQKKQLFFGSVGLVLLILIVRGCGGGASGLSVGDVQAIVDQRVELVNSAMLQQLSGGQPGAAPASDTLKAIPAMRDEIVKLRQEVTELQKQVVAINSRFEETAREIDQVERLASRKGAVAGSVPQAEVATDPAPPSQPSEVPSASSQRIEARVPVVSGKIVDGIRLDFVRAWIYDRQVTVEFKLTNITEKDREFVIREGKTKMADQSGVDHLLDHFVYGNEPKKGDLRQTLSSSIPLQLKAVFSDIDPNTTTIPVFRIHMERPGYPQDKIVIDFRNAPIELSATP